MSFEGEQQKIEHTGTRKKFSAYISMLWPDQKLMYDFYDRTLLDIITRLCLIGFETLAKS